MLASALSLILASSELTLKHLSVRSSQPSRIVIGRPANMEHYGVLIGYLHMTRPVRTSRQYKDPLVGTKVGKLLVMKRLPDKSTGAKNVRAVVLCRCDCGNITEMVRYYLIRSNPKTHCGCEKTNSIVSKFPTEHGIWKMMQVRCYDEKHVAYKDYGGRGIRVCARWLADFEAFLTDMGPRPTPFHSIDRMDVNGNYEKSNCRWATPEEQRANQRPKLNEA